MMAAQTLTTRRAAPARGAQVVVLRGSGTPQRRAPSGVRRAGARAGRAAAQLAWEEKHTLVAVGAGAVLGLARKNKWKLPKVGGLTPAATMGLAAWAVGRFTKNKMAQHAATGLLSIAAYELTAFTSETRDQIDALVREQRTEDEDED